MQFLQSYNPTVRMRKKHAYKRLEDTVHTRSQQNCPCPEDSYAEKHPRRTCRREYLCAQRHASRGLVETVTARRAVSGLRDSTDTSHSRSVRAGRRRVRSGCGNNVVSGKVREVSDIVRGRDVPGKLPESSAASINLFQSDVSNESWSSWFRKDCHSDTGVAGALPDG